MSHMSDLTHRLIRNYLLCYPDGCRTSGCLSCFAWNSCMLCQGLVGVSLCFGLVGRFSYTHNVISYYHTSLTHSNTAVFQRSVSRLLLDCLNCFWLSCLPVPASHFPLFPEAPQFVHVSFQCPSLWFDIRSHLIHRSSRVIVRSQHDARILTASCASWRFVLRSCGACYWHRGKGLSEFVLGLISSSCVVGYCWRQSF